MIFNTRHMAYTPDKFIIPPQQVKKATELVVRKQAASATLIQLELGIGYYKAHLIMDELESLGIIGPENGLKPRAVLKQPTTSDSI